MGEDPDMELIKAIRRDRTQHDYLCKPCAHRFHSDCEDACEYCGVQCACVCRRWALPVERV